MDSDYIQYIANLINEDDLDLIVEEQIDYLTRRYGEQVDQELIQQAIDISVKYAERLLFGYVNGDIDSISSDNIELVKDLDPFKKEIRKSETDLEFDVKKQKAKQISRKYWQWITRIWKDDPNAEFDQSWFDYLQYAEIPSEELLTKSIVNISRESDRWHAEEFENQDVGGDYSKHIEDSDAEQIDDKWWIVPIYTEDAKIEGAKMQNCIGGFCMPGSNNKLFSLRDKFNSPKVSIDIKKAYRTEEENAWGVAQIKGKQNKSPKQKYVKPVIQWLLKHPEHYTSGVTSDFWNIIPDDEKLINTFIMQMSENVSMGSMGILNAVAQYFKSGFRQKPTTGRAVDYISEKTADFLISQPNNVQLDAGHTLNEIEQAILMRASPNLLETLLKDWSDESAYGFMVQWPKAILATGKVKHQHLKAMLQDKDVSTIIKAMIYAQYMPNELEQFMSEHADPSDIIEKFNDYKDVIDIMPDAKSPYAAKLLRAVAHTRTTAVDIDCKLLLRKTPDNLLANVMKDFANIGNIAADSGAAGTDDNILFKDLNDVIEILDRNMSDQGYLDALKIMHMPAGQRNRTGNSILQGHNGGGILRTIKTRIIDKFDDETLEKVAKTKFSPGLVADRIIVPDDRVQMMAADILAAKYGATRLPEQQQSPKHTMYYSTDIDELKTAAKATRSKKLQQQIENKIKRIRRRRRKVAQAEREKSLEQKLDTI